METPLTSRQIPCLYLTTQIIYLIWNRLCQSPPLPRVSKATPIERPPEPQAEATIPPPCHTVSEEAEPIVDKVMSLLDYQSVHNRIVLIIQNVRFETAKKNLVLSAPLQAMITNNCLFKILFQIARHSFVRILTTNK